MWYVLITQKYIKHNKQMLHYNNIRQISEISQITKYIFNACPPWF
jgi:hypothetical protein